MIPEMLGLAPHAVGLVVVVVAMVIVFVTERLPVDVTAMGVLLLLILGGYVSTGEAFAGFSSPVVVVMVCTLFVVTALRMTGVSDAAARWIQKYAGSHERRAIAVVMIISALLSGFMNNVSAAALLMPAVAVLSHETDIPPSRLFIPLAFSVSIGGMMTLIGTPPNILAAEILMRSGIGPISFFHFTPYALVALVLGVLFMALYGYTLLPVRKTQRRTRRIGDLRALYRLQERLFCVRVPEHASCDGRSLSELRFGSFVGGVVVTIIRGGRKVLSPKAGERIHERDVLLVRGSPDRFSEIQALQGLRIEEPTEDVVSSIENSAEIVRFGIREVHTETRLLLLREILRSTGIIPLAVERPVEAHPWETHPPSWFLDSVVHKGDTVLGCIAVRFYEDSPLIDIDLEEIDGAREVLKNNLYSIAIQPGGWSGAPLHRLAHETKLSILGLITPTNSIEWLDVPVLLPNGESGPSRLTADHVLREGERYLVSGSVAEARTKETLSSLTFEAEAEPSELESEEVGMVELVLTPRSEFIGRTLADLHFREKYDCQVLALWRDGKPHLSLSSSLPLLYGDALLVQGPLKSMPVLAKDPDFLLLSEHRKASPLSIKSFFSILALFMLMFIPLFTGMPVHEAAFMSACVVIFSGAVSMEQVYREIDWRVVFLLAMMIPLGLAVERMIAVDSVMPILGHLSQTIPPLGMAALFMICASIVSQMIDSSVAVIFLGPIAVALGYRYGTSPHLLVLAVTFGSSLAFMLPTSSRSNLLVTGAGGYRAADFFRVGLPFTIVVGLGILGMLALLAM
jgi:di/tricarboxylate transporter